MSDNNHKQIFHTFTPPPKPKWKLRIGAGNGLVFRLTTAPNRFYRFIQKVMLGFNWKEIGDE